MSLPAQFLLKKSFPLSSLVRFSTWSDGETLSDFFSRRGGKGYRQQFIYETELLELLEKGLTEPYRFCGRELSPGAQAARSLFPMEA